MRPLKPKSSRETGNRAFDESVTIRMKWTAVEPAPTENSACCEVPDDFPQLCVAEIVLKIT
jgi:hypothetical protein